MKTSTFLLICLGSAVLVSAYIPIPKGEVGFVYKDGSPTAAVKVDLYIDQLCSHSKNAFPTMLKVADHYGPAKLRLRTRLFSLPYIKNGFYTAKGAHIVDKLSNKTLTYSWIQKVFEDIDSLDNVPTQGNSDNQLMDQLTDIAVSVGVPASSFKPLLLDSSIERAARVEWKYACTRRITGTPTFMVNDVVVGGTPTWSVSDWKEIIDPLLGIKQQTTPKPPTSSGSVVFHTRWIVGVFGVLVMLIIASK